MAGATSSFAAAAILAWLEYARPANSYLPNEAVDELKAPIFLTRYRNMRLQALSMTGRRKDAAHGCAKPSNRIAYVMGFRRLAAVRAVLK